MIKKAFQRLSDNTSLLSVKFSVSVAAVALASGCSQFQPLQRPDVALPAAWPTAPAQPAAALSSTMTGDAVVADPGLKALVTQALANNRDARVAAFQVAQLRAQAEGRDAVRWPTVNAGLTSSRQTVGANEPIKSNLTAGVQITAWEMDFFGRLESLKEAALAQYLAAEQTRQSTQLSLVAGVATAWLNLQTSDALLALTQQTLATREQALRLTRLRHESGIASALELRQAESLAASAQVALAQQQRQRALDRNALALLVGQPVDQPLADAALRPAGDPTQALAEVPVGLPSEVLLSRPDVRAAEQQLAAANANVGAARAAFFPRVSLTASLGSVSSELSGLFKGGTWGWALAPQALLPIFDGGANQANLTAAQAARDVALAQYEKAIQTAFKEVNDALVSRASLAEQLRAQSALVAAESERLRLSELRLSQGVSGQLDVLDAQRGLFAAQQALLQVQTAQVLNRVALFKATAGL
ncbi:MAG TPA: efflux transporter outer membrane subunit [Burkholderiaceae bacterium]|nr:efflux transporter outer membrane subunit [Burkholderiaceae bacterium]